MKTLFQLFHRHQWITRKNYAILDGDLVALVQEYCLCGLCKEPELIIIATKAELEEANNKIITTKS